MTSMSEFRRLAARTLPCSRVRNPWADLTRVAFAKRDPSTRPTSIDLDTPKWLGLQVRHHQETGDTVTVELMARYKVGGKAHRMHEISRFNREDGRRYYVDGDFPG